MALPAMESRIVLLAASWFSCGSYPRICSGIADPSVSFDGKRILFSGKRTTTDKWDIWEMDLDGKNKRQITRDFGNCREPEYLARSSITPPDFEDKVRWITFISDAAGTFAGRDGNGARHITLCRESGTCRKDAAPLPGDLPSTSPSDFSPTVLQDGRVLFTSRQKYADTPEKFPLLAANWDGTGLNLFCGTDQGTSFKTMACEMPDRTLVFVESANPIELRRAACQSLFRRPLHSYETAEPGNRTVSVSASISRRLH